jgi:hypothetical protein
LGTICRTFTCFGLESWITCYYICTKREGMDETISRELYGV